MSLGLIYQENVLTPALEQEIVTWLDQQPWSSKLSRRTQQYGYEYNYSSKKVEPTLAPPLAGPIKVVADYLSAIGIMTPTQCIVNDYTQTQGINPHIDSPQFGPTIVSISLLQPCNMEFRKGEQSFIQTLMPRSLLGLTGESRSQWTHSIPSRKTVTLSDGSLWKKPEDYRRVSLTFRTLAQ